MSDLNRIMIRASGPIGMPFETTPQTSEKIIRHTLELIKPHNLQSTIDRLAIVSGGKPFSDEVLGGHNGCYEVSALTLSDEEINARKEVRKMFGEYGLSEQDIYDHPMAVMGMLRSKNPDAPTLVIGSHTDTVQKGGAFDGRAGISMMLETLRVLKEQGVNLGINVLFTAFAGEESAAFGTAFLGSRALVGEITDEILDYPSSTGRPFRQALEERNINPDDLKKPFITEERFGPIIGFIEGHIEQADDMRNEDVTLQVNEAIAGANRQKIILKTNLKEKSNFKNPKFLKVSALGQANHSGSTMMDSPDRKDGLVMMSYLLENLESLQKRLKEQGLDVEISSSSIKINDQAMSKIPGKTEIIIGIDGDDPSKVEIALKQLDQLVKEQNEKIKEIKSQDEMLLIAESSIQDRESVPLYESGDILSAYRDVSKIIQNVEKTFLGLAEEKAVGTVTTFKINDKGETELEIDMRGISEKRDEGVEKVIQEIGRISEQSNIKTEVSQVPGSLDPGVLDHEYAEQLLNIAEKYGLGKTKRDCSGAGHDAMIMSNSKNITKSGQKIPVAHFFIPSDGGSHKPPEFTSPEDMAIGCHLQTAFIMEVSLKFSEYFA